MKINYSVRSNKGLVRENNEDNIYADGLSILPDQCNRPFSLDAVANAPLVLAVCDGMGGENYGEKASQLAVDRLAENESQIKTATPDGREAAVQDFVNSVNEQLNSEYERTGTTLALVVITPEGAFCYNVGDTRIYCMKGGSLKQVSVDHTHAAEISSSDHQRRSEIKDGNKLTRCIGIGDRCTVESYKAIRGKARLMICSDGLTDMVADDEIASVLADAASASDAAERLVRSAMNNGGYDNVSVIVADIPWVSVVERLKNKLMKGDRL